MKRDEAFKEEHHLFRWSKPIGYNFDDVDKAIEEYKSAIKDAKALIEKKDIIIVELQSEKSRLEGEVTNLELQLRSFPVQEEPEESSIEILSDFAKAHDGDSAMFSNDDGDDMTGTGKRKRNIVI